MNYLEPNKSDDYQYGSTADITYNDGWILYYSPEGYPYYYNEQTGDSQWAEYDEPQSQDPGEEGDSSTPSYSGSHTHSDDDDDESTGTDSEYEAQFQEYLQSEEGRSALEAEKNLVERYALKSANQSANAADVDNEGTLVDDNIYAYPQYAPNDMNYGRGYSPDKYPSRNHHTGPHQMSEREVSHFIHTYGLPSPPNRPAGSITLPPSPRRSPRPPASGAGAGRGVRFADDEEDVEGGGGGGRRVRGGHSAEGRVSVGDMDDDDSSVSSDDEDVKLIKEPLVPAWITGGTSSVLTTLQNVIRTPFIFSVRAVGGFVASPSLGEGNSVTATLNGLLRTVTARVYEYMAYTAEYLVDGSVSQAGRSEQPESMPP